MLPALPTHSDEEVEALKTEVVRAAGHLGKGLHPKLIAAIGRLLVNVNSYYTNAMEGNPSRLRDIERALAKRFSSDRLMRNYQHEHLAHIHTQEKMFERLEKESDLEICSAEFLCWLHETFYSQLPQEMHFATSDSGKKIPVKPGTLRDLPLHVGRHVPPETLAEVRHYVNEFRNTLSPFRIEPSKIFLGFASSHHRILWIHPFRDRNGRVARLFTMAYQFRLKIHSHGLWTVTRAFARNRAEYDGFLDLADQPRQNDLDGRGNLSDKNLLSFCKYFLRQCLDQILFMDSLLELNGLHDRLNTLITIERERKLISKGGAKVLSELFFKGEIKRGEVQSICNVKPRRAALIIKELLKREYVRSSSAHGPLNLNFVGNAVPILFPKLVE